MNSATQSPPTGPRPRWTDEEIEFYTHANFLRAFGEYHEQNSHRFDEEDPALANRAEDEVNIRNQLLLQGYLNGVAYLCDVKKGGKTVSANGIDQNIKLYIAANEKLPWPVRKFVIKVLMKTDFLNHPMDVVVQDILEKAVEKARHRIDFYVEQLRRSFVNCRASLETHFRGTEILPWIEYLTRPQNHYELVLKCYKARGRQLKEIKTAAAAAASSHTDWMDLIHYIGRLGAHNYHVLKIVTAYKKLPFLQRISEIVFIPSSPRKAFTFSDDAFNYSATSKKVSKNLDRPELVRKAIYLHLMARWYDSEQEVKSKLEEKREISTRVHAEILIFDYFVKNGLEFFDGYRYIGCSKPACFFCYHWLQRQGVRDLRSHSKVILKWRGPDFSGAEANMSRLKRSYDFLVQTIAESVFQKVLDLDGSLLGSSETRRYQSSQGSSSIPPLRSEVSVRS